MIRLCIPLICVPLFAAAVANPRLSQVQSVYVLPMRSGMDQYLANRLTQSGKMQVLADPKSADAVLTDHLGDDFEKKLNDLYPPQNAATKEADKADKKDNSGFIETDVPVSTLSRGKGNFFLVDRKTRAVLWSIYEPPKGSAPDDLNKVAERVVQRLVKDAAPSQK